MPNPRSKRLVGPIQVPNAPVVAYTCPAGVRALLKSWSWVNAEITPQVINVFVNGPGFGFQAMELSVPSTGLVLAHTLVLNPGDDLRILTPTSTVVQVTVSGAELTL